jgi:hypothetical protein
MQGLLKKNEKKMTRSFNFTFRYIDDVLSLNNSRFCDFVDRIYPIELVRQTFYNANSLSNLFTNVAGDTILQFLKEIDLYTKI